MINKGQKIDKQFGIADRHIDNGGTTVRVGADIYMGDYDENKRSHAAIVKPYIELNASYFGYPAVSARMGVEDATFLREVAEMLVDAANKLEKNESYEHMALTYMARR